MLLSEPLAHLITHFRTSLVKFYQNSQQISDSFYRITESSECRSAMFKIFCVGIHIYNALTYDVIKCYITRVWDKKIRNDYIKLEKRVVM